MGTIQTDTSTAPAAARSPREGLTVELGVFDVGAWEREIAPVATASARVPPDHEPLLLLAEELADLRDAVGPDPGATTPIERLGRVAEALLLFVQRAEDSHIDLGSTRRAGLERRYAELRGEFLMRLCRHSTSLEALLELQRPEGEDEHEIRPLLAPARVALPRPQLAYWTLALVTPDFEVASGPHPPRALSASLRACEARSQLQSLLRGSWTEWPGFPPNRVVRPTLGHNRDVETTPTYPWAIRRAPDVAILRSKLEARMHRWLLLGALEVRDSSLYRDLVDIWRPDRDAEFDRIVAEAAAELGVTVDQGVWAYLVNESDELAPDASHPLSAVEGLREAGPRVLALFRAWHWVLTRAVDQGAGLYLILSRSPQSAVGQPSASPTGREPRPAPSPSSPA